jgi:CP family cyanate transporter-like MFS transporter
VSGTAALVGLFLAALALRPQVLGVGPLLPEIQTGLDTSHAVAGLLGTIPVLCMGLFAPAAAYLAARLGTRRAMTTGLVLIGSFGILRALAPEAWLVVALTWGVGAGMGLGNALAPLAVREVVPRRAATGTGIYTGGIQVGSTTAAAIAVPLAAVLGGWRGALVALSALALGSALAWALLTRGTAPHERPAALWPRLPLRSPVGWLLVAIFALMACAYYGLSAWLPDAYLEHGWSERAGGALLAAMNLTAIGASFALPWISQRRGGRPPWLLALSGVFVVGAVGLVAVPALGLLWALLTGVAQGGMFALVMMLPLDLETRPERVRGLVAMMLGFGYTIGALSPFVLGGVRDVTESFAVVLWTCVAFLVVLVGAVVLLRAIWPSSGRRTDADGAQRAG